MQRLKAFGIPAGQFLQVNENGLNQLLRPVKGKTLFQVNYANYRGFFNYFFLSVRRCAGVHNLFASPVDIICYS